MATAHSSACCALANATMKPSRSCSTSIPLWPATCSRTIALCARSIPCARSSPRRSAIAVKPSTSVNRIVIVPSEPACLLRSGGFNLTRWATASMDVRTWALTAPSARSLSASAFSRSGRAPCVAEGRACLGEEPHRDEPVQIARDVEEARDQAFELLSRLGLAAELAVEPGQCATPAWNRRIAIHEALEHGFELGEPRLLPRQDEHLDAERLLDPVHRGTVLRSRCHRQDTVRQLLRFVE